VQFTLILFNATRAFYTSCGVDPVFYYFFIPNILIIFYEFYQFYQKAYVRREGKAKSPPKARARGKAFRLN
jgi:hypothetical protein